MTKAEALESIRRNIASHGQHVYLVQGWSNPRYAYTIGLSEAIGSELILAGGAFYSAKEVFEVINRLASVLRATHDPSQTDHSLGELGIFSLLEVHQTWSSKLVLGAIDYYKTPLVPALQIVPDAEHITIDVPNLSQAFSAETEPVWQWLEKPWDYSVPKNTVVITDLDALRGEIITEAARWEETHWEIYAGSVHELDKKDMRVVPFGTLLGADPSLKEVTDWKVGKARWRDPSDLVWRKWRNSGSDDD
jgi:hypothetical protein